MTQESENYLTIHEVAFMIGTRKRIIERLISLELIQPTRVKPQPYFSPEILPRLRRLMRLHDQLGISWTSMGLVLELMEQVEQLKRRLEHGHDDGSYR